MKGWRFYEEYKSTKRKVSTGNVIAVDTTQRLYPMLSYGIYGVGLYGQYQCACISAWYEEPNSPVCCGATAVKYIQRRCKRISEAKAREIHPKLFEYLEGG